MTTSRSISFFTRRAASSLRHSRLRVPIREHPGKVTVFVPHYAMSGGTLIALAADEIVMCKHSVLGPIDPQLGNMPAASLLKVIAEKPIARIRDQTLVLADVGRKAIEQVKQSATDLLARRLPAEQASALAEKLSTGTWTHDYPSVRVERQGARPAGQHRHAGRRSRSHEALPAADADAEYRWRGISAGAAAARDCKTHLSGH